MTLDSKNTSKKQNNFERSQRMEGEQKISERKHLFFSAKEKNICFSLWDLGPKTWFVYKKVNRLILLQSNKVKSLELWQTVTLL